MGKLPKIALHFLLIGIVVILPVYIFEFMTRHEYHDFAFIGGATYFIYIGYWITRIKNVTAKTMLWSILQFILIMIVGLSLAEIRNLEVALPLLLLLNLLAHVYLLIKNPKSKNRNTWKAFLFSFITIFLLSLLGIFFWFYALAMSGMPNMRY